MTMSSFTPTEMTDRVYSVMMHDPEPGAWTFVLTTHDHKLAMEKKRKSEKIEEATKLGRTFKIVEQRVYDPIETSHRLNFMHFSIPYSAHPMDASFLDGMMESVQKSRTKLIHQILQSDEVKKHGYVIDMDLSEVTTNGVRMTAWADPDLPPYSIQEAGSSTYSVYDQEGIESLKKTNNKSIFEKD